MTPHSRSIMCQNRTLRSTIVGRRLRGARSSRTATPRTRRDLLLPQTQSPRRWNQREHQTTPAAVHVKNADPRKLVQTDLNWIAAELNNRPRRALGYRSSAEVYADFLTSGDASAI